MLTDIQLPGALNGRALAQKAREHLPALPVIYMTGRPDPRDTGSAIDVFIAKPMTNSVRDAAQIRAAARAHPDRLVGALNPARFATAIRQAHARVQAGEIGEVLTARAWIQHGAPNATASRQGNPESDDAQGGLAYSLSVYA